MALVHDGEVAITGMAVESPGTFPPGTPAQVQELAAATLPKVLARMIPVPILFDLFHLVPLANRNREPETLKGMQGWLTLLQPVTTPS